MENEWWNDRVSNYSARTITTITDETVTMEAKGKEAIYSGDYPMYFD